MTYKGTLKDINNALNDLIYTPTANYSGNDELTLVTNNLAGAELGGDQMATTSTALVIQPLATSPTITTATTNAKTQTTSGLVITPGSGTPNATYFKITTILYGTLFQNDGTTLIAEGSFISVAQGGAGLKFTPSGFIGQASFTVQSATSDDSSDLVGTEGTGTITVSQLTSSTTLAASSSSVPIGQSLTFTATISPASATGTVTDGTTTLESETLSGGTATFSTAGLAVGSHTITAQYGGDTITQGSTSATTTVAVTTFATTTTLGALATPASVGQSVTLTATVTPASATGTVTFLNGTTALGTGSLSTGTATLTTTMLPVGVDSITAEYGGDTNDAKSTSDAQSLTVNALPTTTALSGPSSSVSAGQSASFTATVSPSSATGTVTFLDGTTKLGAEALSGGAASFSTTGLAVGNHTITAQYGGDATDATSSSTPVTVTITSPGMVPTTTNLTASATSIAPGNSVALTATVSSTSGTPTGTLVFMDGATVLDTETLVAGTASFSTPSLSSGSHSIVAQYQGTTTFNPSASQPQTITVGKTETTTSLVPSATSVTSGQTVSFTATVSPFSATGTVTFLDRSTTLATESLAGGTASFSTSVLTAGDHIITAQYGGDGTDATSSSSPATVVVGVTSPTSQGAAMVLLEVGPNPNVYGQAVTLTAVLMPTAGGIVDGGQVHFVDGTVQIGIAPVSEGAAVLSINGLNVGTHYLQAYFEGDDSFAPSASPIETATIEPAPSHVSLISTPTTAAAGSALSLVVHVELAIPSGSSNPAAGPTGLVQFFAGDLLLGESTVGSDGVSAFTATMPSSTQVQTVHATYLGDANYQSASSPALNIIPPPQPIPTTAVAESPAQPTATTTNVIVSVSRTKPRNTRLAHIVAEIVTTEDAAVITGQVTFSLKRGRRIKQAEVVVEGGIASLDLRVKPGSRWIVTATYSGTPALLPSASANVRFSGRLSPRPLD